MTSEPLEIQARKGVAVRLGAGQSLEVINTHGTQVIDFWCFAADDTTEFLSVEHMRGKLSRVCPKPGDPLVTNHRESIMTFVEDTSPGVHDTLVAACDSYRYAQLGCSDYHDSCTDNLHRAMAAIGIEGVETPSPFNLWMNTPAGPDGTIQWLPPVSKPGDRVVFRAERDCIAVMSSCPQDIIPINGAACTPVEAHYRVHDAPTA